MHQFHTSNYYSILGVSENADQQTIKQAYRRLAVSLHPDTQDGLPEEQAKALFIAVNEAYETLSNPVQRSVYDTFLYRQTAPPQETHGMPAMEQAPQPPSPQERMMNFQRKMYLYFFRYHVISLGTFLLSILLCTCFLANMYYFGTYELILTLLPVATIAGLLAQYYYVFIIASLNNMHDKTRGNPIRVLPVWKCAAIVLLILTYFVRSYSVLTGPFPDWMISLRNMTGKKELMVPERSEAQRRKGEVISDYDYIRLKRQGSHGVTPIDNPGAEPERSLKETQEKESLSKENQSERTQTERTQTERAPKESARNGPKEKEALERDADRSGRTSEEELEEAGREKALPIPSDRSRERRERS